jgi:CBS domain containing-hemolysin-like protein
MTQLDADTLPGCTKTPDITELATRTIREPVRIGVNDPISVLPAMFARSTATVAVVVDEQDRPLGVIRPSALLTAADEHGRDSLLGLDARDLMEPVRPLRETASLRELVKHCTAGDRACVVVVDAGQHLLGVVTAQDLLRFTETLLSRVEDWQKPVTHVEPTLSGSAQFR